MSKKKIKWILTIFLTCICLVCITIIDLRLYSSSKNVSFEMFEKEYLNIIDNFASSTDGQIVFSKKDGLFERNGCYMIDGSTFSRMTGVSITHSDYETKFHYGDKRINIKNNTISNQNGDTEILPQEVEYFNGNYAFPIQTVSESLGYKVNINSCEEEQSVTLTREFSTKRLIVKYKGNLNSCGAVASAEGYNGLHIFQYRDEESTASAYNYFKGLSYIEYVESDEVVTVEETKTESSTASLSSTYKSWGAEAMGVGNYASHIQNTISTLPEVIVAVIDTGIDTDHEWFTNRIAAGGKNFSTSKTDNKVYEYEDDEGHGTHVSGIIADLTLSNVKILPIKVMNESGIGYTSSIVLGIQYVTSLKKSGRNIRAINMSLGGSATTESNKLYSDSITEAHNYGILPVVSAGNENTDTAYITPANVSCAVTVAALANANSIYYRPYYSNYGSYVDVCAPGSSILSARMGGGTVTMSGTSMAAPHVAAAAALVFTEHNEYTHSQVEKLLKDRAVDLGDAGKDKYYGYGMVNLRYIYAELLSDVTFDQTNLECTHPFNLTITHSDTTAEIYYTTDGTLPTPENGTLYTSPIWISHSVKIRAAAYVFEGSTVVSYSNPKEIVYRFGNQDLENCFIVDSNSEGLVYYQGVLENLTVPQVIDGVTIRTICSGAFTSTKVVNVILPNTVTEIQSNAFSDCKNLETVQALNVKSIGNYAFQGCSKFMYLTDEYFLELTKIGAYAFYQCANLRDISLSKVEIVDAYAFYMRNTDPKYLTSINLPSVKIISSYAFNYATYVTEVNLPKVEVLSEGAFQMNDIRTLYLPKAVYLGSSAFFGNDKMASADLPEVLYLSTDALAGTVESGSILSSVNLPKAKVLGTYFISHTLVTHLDLPSAETLLPLALYTQRLLESISVPNLKYVGSCALGYCEGLTEINLPSVISLSDSLYACKNLQKITLSPCLEKMACYSNSDRGTITAFRYIPETCVIYYYKGTAFEDFYETTGIVNPIINLSNDEAFTYVIVNGEVYITGLNGVASNELVIPSYIDEMPVTKICAYAFYGCSSSMKLNALYLKEIEENAFKGCSNLTDIYLTRINYIGAYAFANCSKLERVTIDNIVEIGDYAFNGCIKFKTITLPNTISSIGEKALGFNAGQLISGFVIYGDENTLAHTYALENGVQFEAIFEKIKGFYFNTYINEKTGNEELYIALVDTQTTGNIIIPESYNGKIISKIGDEAFSDCLISGVILPETITDIGQQAFSNCHFLESINLENILTVGARAFRSCQLLKYVNMPLVKELPWAVFSSCGNLKMADLSGVIEIGQDVFNECYELEKVICPNLEILDAAFKETISLKSVDTKNVVKIIGNAFIYSKSIEELYFPNLETITSGGVFSACPSLKKVVIGEKFENYVVDQTLDLASWTYYNVPIYGYSGSKAEEWALKCLDETKTKHWDFVAIDDMDNLAITKDLSSELEVEYNSPLNLSVEAEGIGLTYQWFRTDSDNLSGTPIKDATDSQLEVDTTTTGTSKYFVQVSDWKGNVISSQICEVTIVRSDAKSIQVTLGEHISSLQNGNNQVNEGENFKVTFTVETGYHIDSIVVDEVNLSEDELETALLDGYTFTNITENHTITINSAPDQDTEYKVYHYKESLVETEIEIDGKCYELETETLTGTTGTLTTAVENTYQGFTAEAFEQKIISGNGTTIVEILYNRNTYTVTLVDCEGVTVEGEGNYLYGETVVVKASVEDGYIWVEWESSNPNICPNNDTLEYTFTMPAEDITLTAKADEVQANSVYIKVSTGEHISSLQNGNNQVDEGESFKVTFTVEKGYHISSIVVDEVALNEDEFESAIINGYTFTNLTENHTITISSTPNEDTEYKVYHYIQSLAKTEVEIDGKYYELEIETLTGTTGTLTNAVENAYQGFTADVFEQKMISGNGNTIVEILYNRNTYTVTLVECEGVTVEGSGAYLYGEIVVVNASVDEGYIWVEWKSSNTNICPNKDTLEYTFTMPAKNITLTAKVNEVPSELLHVYVAIGQHMNSLQNGDNLVNIGDNFKVALTVEIGYHIASIIVDKTVLSANEMNKFLKDGYTFTNITENHTITINSTPNEDTKYKVHHYIQSLVETPYKINGKYYELEIEDLTGTTGTLTTIVARKYEGFTAASFQQKIISGNGNTLITLLYNRNSYTVTLVDSEGVIVEGAGIYLYGETIVVKANVDEGYKWIGWESSNTTACPNQDTKEYTFSMPSCSIELKAVATKLTTPEQPEPNQPEPEQPKDTKEKGFNFVLWISIGVSLFILILFIIILSILLVKKHNKKKNELNKNL